MAVPIVAIIKAAQTAHSVVKTFVPGGWKTVIVTGIITSLVVPISIIYALVAGFSLNPAPFSVCGTTTVDGGEDPHSDDEEGGGGGGGGGVDTGFGSKKAPNVPFPAEDSASIVYPVNGGLATSSYGPRKSIFINGIWTNKFHDGTDFGAPSGTPIVAMADGIVSTSVNAPRAFEGSMLEIQHQIGGKKYTTAYRHIQGKSIKFKVGDTVKAGQQIAQVGSEGMSTGPHLHFVVAQGPYHRYNSGNAPAGTVNAINFLKEHKGGNASGGLEGDDFSEPYNPDANASDEQCGPEGANKLPGDGTNKWNAFENGTFDKDNLKTEKGVTLFTEATEAYIQMAKKYKEDTKKDLSVKTSYLSVKDQEKLYDSGKQIEKAGQSVFGWARLIEFSGINDRNNEAYKWLNENAKDYGWEQPSDYSEGGSTDSPAIWGYVGGGEAATSYPPAGNATVASNRALAKKIMEEDYPEWSEADYACLVVMWHRESSWDHKAANPISSARGIAQAMMSIHFGDNWRTSAKGREYLESPEAQIRWGFNYIKKHRWFSSPCEAQAFWNETDPSKKGGIGGHWY